MNAASRGSVRTVAILMVIGMSLTGCASDPRYAQGLEWVLANEQEQARLQGQGFPQMGWGASR